MTQPDDPGRFVPGSDIWWPSSRDVKAVHRRVMEREGRRPEFCQEPLLEGALARGLNRAQYEGVQDVLTLGAWLCVDLARSHSFSDGNKRTAMAVLALFYDVNGYALKQRGRTTVAAQLIRVIQQFQVSEDAGTGAVQVFADLIRSSSEKKPSRS